MSPSFIFPQGWTNNPASNEYTDFGEEPSEPFIHAGKLKLDSHGLPLEPQPSDSQLDPLIWQPWVKFAIHIQVSISAFMGLFSQEIISLAYMPLAESMGVTVKEASYSTTIATIFAGLAPLIYAPMSNIYGRRPVYLIATAVGVAANAVCAVCESWTPFLVARACVGIGSSVGMAIGAAVVTDLFFVHQRGLFMGIYLLFVANGAHVATFAGGFIVKNIGWRWCCWVPAISMGIIWAINMLCLPETLYQRDNPLASSAKKSSWIRILGFTAARPTYEMRFASIANSISLLKYPTIVVTTLYYSIAFGLGTALIHITGPMAFQEIYHFNICQIGMAISIPATIGSILGEFLSGAMSDEMLYLARKQHGYADPETRLHATWIGTSFLPAGVIMQGVCLQYHTHWAGPVAGIGTTAFGLQIVSTPIFGYLVDCYDANAAEISALLNFGRLMFSFPLRFYMIPLANETTYGIAWSILAIVSIILYVGVIAVMWKGAAWRNA
ncbi:Sugar and other transporter [Aspergillus sclerotialis]|uniref:Sugar and other transporter n=1 Tax=Aspergillus sclerotialis TaxID=2070753 RepID=A0A3A2ZIH4_9EURO|nr:Sugar and other transporter [Aspergillus sclerotialis]